jgi:hypothetical protein
MMKGLLISEGWVRGLRNPIADLNRDAGGKSARGGPRRCRPSTPLLRPEGAERQFRLLTPTIILTLLNTTMNKVFIISIRYLKSRFPFIPLLNMDIDIYY